MTEFKKKQDADLLKAQSMSVSSTNIITEKGSTPLTLSAPAANTGGRDATVLRSSSMVSSSALDLIKKKLQDPGASPGPSPGAALPGAISSDLNGAKLAEGTVRDPETENSKEKIKDSNGESNLSDSSSESEDDDNGPSKEECIIRFKVYFFIFLLFSLILPRLLLFLVLLKWEKSVNIYGLDETCKVFKVVCGGRKCCSLLHLERYLLPYFSFQFLLNRLK